MSTNTPFNEQAALMAEGETVELRAQIKSLRRDIAELQHEADLDACHIAGLTAQIKALIAESQACPHQDAHPLVQTESYTHSQTGEPLTKTRAFPLYREAFDTEAKDCGIENPEEYRS